MQQPLQSDSLDYDNPEFEVNENIQQNHGFEDVYDDAFDDMPILEMDQIDHGGIDFDNNFEVVDYEETPYENQGFENQGFENQAFEDSAVPLIGVGVLDADNDMGSSRGFGLRNKILLLLFALVTTSLGASLASTLIRVNTSHLADIHANRVLAAESMETHIEDFFVEKVAQLLVLGSTQLIQEGVIQRNLSYAETYGDDYSLFLDEINRREAQWLNAGEDDPLVNSIVSNDKEVNPFSQQLISFSEMYTEHSEIFITDQYGATVASSNRLSDYYQADEAWWNAAWAEGQGEVYISDLTFDESSGTNGFLIAIPLFSDAGNLLGVMRSTLDVAELEAFVAQAEFDKTGHVVLLDKTGEVMVDSGIAAGYNSKALAMASRQDLVNSNRETLEMLDEAGERSLFTTLHVDGSTLVKTNTAGTVTDGGLREFTSIAEAVSYLRTQSISQAISQLDWTLVFRQKYSETTKFIQNAYRWNILIFALTLLATLILGTIFARRLTKPLNHLVDIMRRVGSGDLTTLAKVDTKDEIGVLASSVNDTVVKLRGVVLTERERDSAQEESEMLQNSISGFLDVITDVAQGDLTRRGNVSADILGNVVDATNVMVEEVGYVLTNVKETATLVGNGAQNMILSSESIAESNQSRVHTANQLAEAIHSVSQSMQQMAGQVDTAAATALQTYSASQEGSLVVKDTLVGMQNIRQEVQTIAKRIKNLGDRSLEISEIVETIRHLASQTNLLALNAAIEAAGAGEAGGRFAIVADEVRKLAENSAQATERVSSLIQSVQEEVQDVVISVEDGIREVEGGYELATQAGQRLDDIGLQAQSSAGLAQKIAEIVREQVQRVGIVNSNLQMMSSSGTQSQQVVAEGKQIAEQLQVLSTELLDSLSHFRLEDTQSEVLLVD